jgi:hypothetical protein
MNMRTTIFSAAALLTFALPVHAQTCLRDSLKAVIDTYFSAVELHNLSAIATAPNLRITENGAEIKPGEGLFKTGGKTELRRNVIDIERCGTVTQAVIDETIDGVTMPVIIAVRLKVDRGRVSEIEQLITRKGGTMNFYDPQALLATRDQDWEGILPPAPRNTREYMNEQANKYFDSFTADPQNLPNFATPCHRWEGGMHTTAKTGICSPKGLVLTHTHRRFPVTDLETGLTTAWVNFNKSLPDVHIFKIRSGQVEWIQAVFGGRTQDAIWPDERK